LDDVVILKLAALKYSIDCSVGETMKDKGFFTDPNDQVVKNCVHQVIECNNEEEGEFSYTRKFDELKIELNQPLGN
jgi:hypothetical protein